MNRRTLLILYALFTLVGLGFFVAAAVVFLTGGDGIRGLLLLAWGGGSMSLGTRALWRIHHRW